MLELVVLLNDDMTQAIEALELTPSRTHLLWELGLRGPVTQRVLADALKNLMDPAVRFASPAGRR